MRTPLLAVLVLSASVGAAFAAGPRSGNGVSLTVTPSTGGLRIDVTSPGVRPLVVLLDGRRVANRITSQLRLTLTGRAVRARGARSRIEVRDARTLRLLARASAPRRPSRVTARSLQSPQAPVTSVTNLAGLGLNVNNQVGQSYHDYAIDGTGDSGILVQGSSTSNTFSRIRLTRVAVASAVSWAKHGMYVKARGNTFTDIYAENGGNGVSGFSVRMGNNSFTRSVIKGFTHAVSYYEHDGAAGTVTFKDGDWTFTGDTAVWGDDSNEPPSPYIKQTFVFENIAVHGPAGAKFLKFGSSYSGSGLAYHGGGVTIRNCTLNGKPVTAADIGGVPSNHLTIG